MNHHRIDLRALSIEERIRLIEEIWDSLASTPDAVPLSGQQRDELDRRLDALDQDPTAVLIAEEVFESIRRHRE